MSLTVAALWRYPVKTLAGESISSAELTSRGIPGDRIIQVRGPEGIRTSRRHHRLLRLGATLDPDGRPLVNGLHWNSPEVLEQVRDAAERFNGRLALNADVGVPGAISVGDAVRLVRH